MTAEQKERALELAQHTIGMDSRGLYTTHGIKVYVPYRNYFSLPRPEAIWEVMVQEGYAKRYDYKSGGCEYSMTPNGIQWMVNELKVNICLKY